jgi:catalase-peroxidase
MMLTTDLALKADPSYAAISRRFLENPDQFEDAFARAWYKLLHRDMGPIARLQGPWVPEAQIWQDPIPAGTPLSDADVADLKARVLASGLSVSQLVNTAWASASTFRSTDKRGGANGARIRLEPQRNWEVNNPAELSTVLGTLERVKQESGKNVSIADLIVIGGAAAVEEAARKAGQSVTVPVTTGRGDATQEQTDIETFEPLEPAFDGFRNYFRPSEAFTPESALIEKAFMLNLTVPEMTVLLGGMRTLTGQSEALSNEFFVNLLDVNTAWTPSGPYTYQGRDRATGQAKGTATSVDLVFGANSQLRAVAEVYAQDDSKEKFAQDFVAAWNKVMNLDRYDIGLGAK